MPSWLKPFPGAVVETTISSLRIENSYQVAAPPAQVVAHYRALFAAERLPFHPEVSDGTDVIRGTVPGCNLLIEVRKQEQTTFVEVQCLDAAEASGPPARGNMLQRDPSGANAALTWPEWLKGINGAVLGTRKEIDRYEREYLTADCDTQRPAAEVARQYAKLLRAHGYRTTTQSFYFNPPNLTTVVEGSGTSDPSGSMFPIRIEITPLDGGVQVELRVTAAATR